MVSNITLKNDANSVTLFDSAKSATRFSQKFPLDDLDTKYGITQSKLSQIVELTVRDSKSRNALENLSKRVAQWSGSGISLSILLENGVISTLKLYPKNLQLAIVDIIGEESQSREVDNKFGVELVKPFMTYLSKDEVVPKLIKLEKSQSLNNLLGFLRVVVPYSSEVDGQKSLDAALDLIISEKMVAFEKATNDSDVVTAIIDAI